MTTRLNFLLLTLVLIVGLPFYWLLLNNPSRSLPPRPLAIATLRALADSIPGKRPARIDTVLVGSKRISGNVHAAGSGVRLVDFSVNSFLLNGASGGPVVIDTGTSRALAARLGLNRYSPPQQALVDAALGRARLILATSETADTLGGLAAFAARHDSEMALARARLNAAQVPRADAPGPVATMSWPGNLVLRPAITSRRPIAVAPGIVVIPTGVPTPGSQIIYARLANGREYVFAGDLAPYSLNFRELRTHSRWLDQNQPTGERGEAMRWLRTLRAWQHEAPGLVLLPGHDLAWITDPINHTGIN